MPKDTQLVCAGAGSSPLATWPQKCGLSAFILHYIWMDDLCKPFLSQRLRLVLALRRLPYTWVKGINAGKIWLIKPQGNNAWNKENIT